MGSGKYQWKLISRGHAATNCLVYLLAAIQTSLLHSWRSLEKQIDSIVPIQLRSHWSSSFCTIVPENEDLKMEFLFFVIRKWSLFEKMLPVSNCHG